MKVNQVYSLVNSLYQQATGQADITAVDDTGIISIGKTVLSTADNKDAFLNVLADRIGKTLIRTLDLELEYPNLLKNSYEFGTILQKINIQPFSAKAQKAWQVGEEGFTPNQFDIDKPHVTQTFFTGANAFEFDCTIPDQMLKTAFTGAAAMTAFINGVMAAITDSMTMALNNMSHNAINNFIAEKIKVNNGVIPLITGYNAVEGTTYTQADVKELMATPSFLKYIGMVMRNHITYMGKPSTLFNNSGMVRATKRDNMHVFLSADLASAYATYLESDTFNKELLSLPNYAEYVSMQGTGNVAPNFEDNTTIKVIPASEEGEESPTTITKSYIVGLFVDKQAIVVGLEDRFSATDRNNRNRYTNFTTGATQQWVNDLSEQAVVFVLE